MDPHRFLRKIREESPVFYDPITGLWLVSRHADVLAALVDDQTFRPDNVLTAVTKLSWNSLRILAEGGFDLPPSLANNGTETHPGLRRLVAGFFTGQRLQASVPHVEQVTDECLEAVDHALRRGADVDLARSVAREVPSRVMQRVLGLEDVDVSTLARWTAAVLELFWGRPSSERQSVLAAEAVELYRYLTAHATGHTYTISTFLDELRAHRPVGGRRLTSAEIVAVCYFIIIAGQVTTSQLVSSLFLWLLADSTAWRRIGVDASLADPWIEEILRRDPPLITWRRITSRPVSLRGVALPAGAHVLLMLAGSGSDAEVFPDPERIWPGRPGGRRHLAFGAGRHRCLGAGFSRMEAGIIVSRTAARLPDLRLQDSAPLPYPPLLSFRAPQQVYVERGEPHRT
ncbi:MAG: cytochrome P450 [Pseudonocardiaceae bacterium]